MQATGQHAVGERRRLRAEPLRFRMLLYKFTSAAGRNFAPFCRDLASELPAGKLR